MAALKVLKILEYLKSYKQLPDNLVSLSPRVLTEQKILNFSSFTVIFDPLLVDMECMEFCMPELMHSVLCGFYAFICI